MHRIPAGVNTNRSRWNYVFSPDIRRQLHEMLEFDESRIPDASEPEAMRASLQDAEIVLSTWGAVPLTAELLKACPDLHLIVYAAGSVRPFLTDALMDRNITVSSAIHLNSKCVAEYVLGLILMALKRVFDASRAVSAGGRDGWLSHDKTTLPGYYRTSVGLLGYGNVTRELLSLLRHFDFDLYLSDPYVDDATVRQLGATPATTEHVMSTCDVVSLHHADIPGNRRMIHRENLKLLKPGATFINTARGALVNEQDLAERLRKGDVTAMLDVTDPEPPADGSPLYTLPNCILTPHIAGATGSEVNRFGEFVVREVRNWLAGRPLENPVDLAMAQVGA